jgi:serine-aspartate repeat-containing protein C/D/E
VSPEGSSKRSDYPGNFNGGSGSGSGANNTPVWNGSDLAPTDEGVNVGGFVWIDSTKNGRQNSSERGISGVVLALVDENGNPARDIYGNTVSSTVTDSSGHYLFPRLAPGKYRVIIQDPPGFRSTIPGAGQRAGDSSKGSAVSLNLSRNGDFDLTLDFGYVPTQNLPATGQEMPSLRIGFISLILGICFVLRRRLRFQQN